MIADKYVVEEVLGSGAMGYVVSARHKLIGQRVAIKLIKSSYIDDEDALERFMREARALVAVEGENVVHVLDYGTMADASPYLVMEFLDGRDLLAELRARGPLPLAETAEIVIQACEGLAAVHARGIVHRDVKPANLFLTKRANGRRLVKIVDFGISKAPKLTPEELTLTQSALGSPHYMSPEQVRSARAVDGRSDVWSLGVTLHRTLTGELPFSGDTFGNLVAALLSESPRRLRSIRPELPEEMEAIILRCLEKNPDDRFADVKELADALTPFALPRDRRTSGSLLRAESPTPLVRSEPSAVTPSLAQSSRASGSAGTQRRRGSMALGVALLLVGAGAAMVLAATRTREASTSPPNPRAVTVVASAITDLPLPSTSKPEAAAAYQAALQAVRDASFVTANESFERAATIDPTMAAAELRSAIYLWLAEVDSRRHARAAMALRASLSEQDRELLTAFEPMFVPPHPDLEEARRRVDTLVMKRPGDVELGFLSASVFMNTRPRDEVIQICDRLLELDPKFAAALWLRALVEGLQWDAPAARRTVDQCLAVSPSAASCVRVRATLEAVQGDCAALEEDARRMVAMEEVPFRAYDYLASALFARGGSIDAVNDALQRKWRSVADGARQQMTLLDEAHLAIATGNFASAMKDARELGALAESSGGERDRTTAAILRIDLHTELGETTEAARVADGYLRRMGAWPERDAIGDDPRPLLYAAAARGRLRTPAERDAVLREWVATWSALVPPLERPRVWVAGYALPAETREEAEAAIFALKDYSPLPRFVMAGWTAPAVGKVHALAGRAQDALPELRSVVSSCRALAEPSDVVRARFWLGEALEATGDAAGACGAYQAVVRLWGGEKRSVTANAAKSRLAAIAECRATGP
ncbi:MAG: protein kinase domain-containing protein [Polyangiaceae bacterium]